MRKLLLIALFLPLVGFSQINLRTQADWKGGTGKAILITSGTAIDTVKAITAGYVLTWDGTDFLFSAPASGGSFQPLDADLTAIAGLSPTNDDAIQRKGGAWVNRSMAQLKADLAIDSTDITGFAGKVRGLLSGISPIGYNTTTGVISADTSILATQFDISSKLTIADTVSTLATLYDLSQLQPHFNRSLTDQVTNSTSLVNITNLSVPIGANDSITFTALINVGCSNTNGIRYAVTIPAGAIMKVFISGTSEATRAYSTPQTVTASGATTGTINSIINANMHTRVEGWVKTTGTGGTVQIQGTSMNVANTVTWWAGSYIYSHKH